MPHDISITSRPPNGMRDALRYTVIPLVFMFTLPSATIVTWLIVAHFDGSIVAFASAPLGKIFQLWPRPDWTAVCIISVWVVLQTFLLRSLPGRLHVGPATPAGAHVTYRLNGVPAFLVTIVCFYLGAYHFAWFPPTIVYDHFGAVLMTCNLMALLCSFLLYFKGLRMPPSADTGTTGWRVWDFYWGTELHPRVFGIDLKQLVICRLAMMGWSVVVLSCVAKQIESTGRLSNALAVAAALQLVYIFKFFCWESGYFNTLDVMHYRFGFRNFWGVTSWLPAIYAIVPLYLAGHPGDLPSAAALGILAFGLAAIWLNYDADVQRQRVRATGGNTTVWGRKPAVLPASYQTSDGARHQTVLLVAGWWGLARHFHYVPEMMIAVSWTLPAGFDHALPWFYVVYLIMLLMHRAAYDDRRCLEKYGHIWEVYCARVPYRVIPFAY
ncbi:phosphatidylethanolamine N-methyltransferase family domain-containing protein [Bradyrhizobium diazoefficiens]|uniref:hypothetical protein n=1 Tax=Bradyrhizobium diazoefficiens TaxID=1355477 RepID=UPI00383541FB